MGRGFFFEIDRGKGFVPMYLQKQIRETLRLIGCSQSSFGAIVDVNGSTLSKFMRGAPDFSPAVLEKIKRGVADVVRLSQESGLPLDFRQIGAIRSGIERMHARDARAKVEGYSAVAVTLVDSTAERSRAAVSALTR
jgi:hypothetical protein